ncbi:IS1 family transposase, partial [Shigella sonnei]
GRKSLSFSKSVELHDKVIGQKKNTAGTEVAVVLKIGGSEFTNRLQ